MTKTLSLLREVECPFCSTKKNPLLIPLDDNGLMVSCSICKWTTMTVGGLCHQLGMDLENFKQREKEKINDLIVQIASFTGKSVKFKNDPFLTSVLLLQGEIGGGYRHPPRNFTVKYNPFWSQRCSPNLLLAIIIHHLVHVKIAIDRGYECYLTARQYFAGKEEDIRFFNEKSHYFLRFIEHLWVSKEMRKISETLTGELDRWLLKVTEKGIRAETGDNVLLRWWGYILADSKEQDMSPDAFIKRQIDFYGLYKGRISRRKELEFGLDFTDISLHQPELFDRIISQYKNTDGFAKVFGVRERVTEILDNFSHSPISTFKDVVEKFIAMFGLDRCISVEKCNTEELYR